jgi:hypothetical protein
VGLVPLLVVMEGVRRLHVPLLDHSLEEEEADRVPLDDFPPLTEQMVVLACLYSLWGYTSLQSHKIFTLDGSTVKRNFILICIANDLIQLNHNHMLYINLGIYLK